jgi:uncharacterized protein (DUF305 family)
MEGPGLVDAVTPRSTLQWIVAVVAVLFLAGAAGYAIRAFAEPDPDTISSADQGFLVDMIDHHDQAVEMSIIAQERASDETVRQFATEVIIQQRWELGIMEAVLGRAGASRGTDPQRPAMGWMGMATVPAAQMPGMASADEIRALRTAPPDEVNALFLELMTEHHVAGAEMAEHEAEHGSNAYVRQFASDIARNQRSEIGEYRLLLERLGAAPAA